MWVKKSLCLLIFFSLLVSSAVSQIKNAEESIVLSDNTSMYVDLLSDNAGASVAFGFFYLDIDTDKDGIPDFFETEPTDDLDGDGQINSVDTDDDNDGIPDVSDVAPSGATSMPGSYFRNGSIAEANGVTLGDYWQFVPNNVVNGYFEHPAAYLYIDNNSDSIPDALQTSSTTGTPPYAVQNGYTATGLNPEDTVGYLGTFEYSGSPGMDRMHKTGGVYFYISDDDLGSLQTGGFDNSPHRSDYSDIYSASDGNADYNIYNTTTTEGIQIRPEALGSDLSSTPFFQYRSSLGVIEANREIIFFETTYWTTTTTNYSKTVFNPDDMLVGLEVNPGNVSGDDFGGWTGKADWFPRLQNTNDHDQLAAAVFGGSGVTQWSDIATSPTDGTDPVAIGVATQDWVDTYANWNEKRRILQYIDPSSHFDGLAADPEQLLIDRYNIDLNNESEAIILRQDDDHVSHFLIFPYNDDPNSFLVSVDDINRGDRDYQEFVYHVTTATTPKLHFTLSDSIAPNPCGDTLFFAVGIANHGTDATGLVFNLTPDANTTIVPSSVSPSTGTVNTGNTAGDTDIEVNLGNLNTVDSVWITFSLLVNPGTFPTTQFIDNQASLAGTNFITLQSTDPDSSTYFKATGTDLQLLQDTIKPEIFACPTDIEQTLPLNQCGATISWTAPTADDNCALVSLTSSHNPGDLFTNDTTIVTYTALNKAGQDSVCTFKVILNDLQKPVFSGCPSDINLNVDPGQCNAIATWTPPTASDNCTIDSTRSNYSSGDAFPVGTTMVEYITWDSGGNTDTCRFSVTVSDNINPIINNCPSKAVLNADLGTCSTTHTWPTVTANDNCGIMSLISSHISGDTFPIDTTLVSYTATDLHGNTSTCQFEVIVQDNEDPMVVNCPGTQRANASSSCDTQVYWPALITTDNCGSTTLSSNFNSGDTFPIDTTLVIYTIDDGNGNSVNCEFEVIISDLELPVIYNCPSDVSTSNDPNECGAIVSWTPPTTSDNCGVESFKSNFSPGDLFPIGTTTVTYTSRDSSDNPSTCSFDIEVIDNQVPVFNNCPSNLTVNNDLGMCGAVVNWSPPTASDNCLLDPIVASHTPGNFFPIGTTTINYSVEDESGNIATCSFTITVLDSEAPLITNCPADITLNAAPNNCDNAVSWTPPTSTDNCNIANWTSNYVPGAVFPVGTTTVSYTATDDAGNTTTCSFDVTIIDNQDPVINNCPTDIVVNNDANDCGALVSWTPPTASDNCNVASLTPDHNPGDAFPVGTTTVTYTATDDAGNTATCSFNITIIDNTDPVLLSCPTEIIVPNTLGDCQGTATWVEPTVSDNCAGASFVSTHAPGATFSLDTTLVTYTATDLAGNVSSCSFDVIVQDTEQPQIFDCPSDVYIDAAPGTCERQVTWTLPSATDNCTLTSFISNYNSGDVFPVDTTLITYTATDAVGNTNTCSFDVYVLDYEFPVVNNCPANIKQANDAGVCGAKITWTPPGATDNCGVVSTTSNQNPGDDFSFGYTTVTYEFADHADNRSYCQFDIQITDEENPVIQNCPSDIAVNTDPGLCEASVTWTAPTAIDNCSVQSLVSTHNPGDVFPLGTTTVTYTATDNSNNTITCSFNITVSDVEVPAITNCPVDILLSPDPGFCTATYTWTPPTASDNCGVANLTSDIPNGYAFPTGTTTVTYTATDVNGNQEQCSFDVTVQDDLPPIIDACPTTKINLNTLAGLCTAPATWVEPTATDNCAMQSFTSNYVPGDQFPLGLTTVSYVALDQNNNMAVCEFDVEVSDVELPVLSDCPGDTNLFVIPGTCGSPLTWNPANVSDNCSLQPLVQTHNSGDIFPLGSTTVEFVATDISGNSNSCSFQVTVSDNETPVISNCPVSIEIGTALGSCDSPANWVAPTATDNCTLVSFTSNYSSGDVFPLGLTQVVYTAIDQAGLSERCEFDVVVKDLENPTINNCPANITQSLAPGVCEANINWIAPTASDNCTLVSFDSDILNGSTFYPGITSVTYTAVDAANNTSTCTFDIEITDDEDPVITNCPSNIALNTDLGVCGAEANWVAPNVSDNCTVQSFTSNMNSSDVFPTGITTVTYTATDLTGNQSSCSFDVSVTDLEIPQLHDCPSDITQDNDPGLCEAQVNWTEATTTDNCGIQTFTQNFYSGDVFPLGLSTVTYQVTDINGNTNTCSFDIVIEDTETPTITNCPADISSPVDAGLCTANITWTAPIATDNCSLVSFNQNYFSGQDYDIGTYAVEYIALDDKGLESKCNFEIEVYDPILLNPQFDCPSDVNIDQETNLCGAILSYTQPVTDLYCGNLQINQTRGALSNTLFPIGTTTNSFEITLDGAIVKTCSFDVNVFENANARTEILQTRYEYTETPLDISDISILTDNVYCEDVTVTIVASEGQIDLPGAKESTDGFGNRVYELSGDVTSINLELEQLKFFGYLEPNSTANISINISSEHGTLIGEENIEVFLQGFSVQAMNIITPNGDGKNDFWIVENIELFPDHKIYIFNMWGKKVYEAVAYNNDWDGKYEGKTLPEGTYYYVLEGPDGESYKGAISLFNMEQN